MNVPEKLENMIQELYRQPTSKIEMENITSKCYTQETGIRQGCPLLPYLFTVIMSCPFHDMHHRDHLRTREHRIEGTTHDQVLYVDDTICMSENEEAMTRLIQAIEKEDANYGLRLNSKQFEYLQFDQAKEVKFIDGSSVPYKSNITYLGCNLNDKGDLAWEVNAIIKACMATLNKLHIFFYNSDSTIARELQAFNAIIRSKLMYGMETIAFNTSIQNKLETVQLKRLREIFNLQTTYINRTFSNDYVRHQVNVKLQEVKQKPMLSLIEYHRKYVRNT